MVKGIIITFVGLVGAGKSTHIRLLSRTLRRSGSTPKISWLKTNHLFAYILLYLLSRIVTIRKPDYLIRVFLTYHRRLFDRIYNVWLALDLISMLVRYITTILLPLKLGRIILVEEYVPAILADLHYFNYRLKRKRKPWIARLYETILLAIYNKHKNIVVYIYADPQVLHKRWIKRGTPIEDLTYILFQEKILKKLAMILPAEKRIFINTSHRSLIEVHNEIYGSLIQLIRENN